jgi:hypothetical protein
VFKRKHDRGEFHTKNEHGGLLPKKYSYQVTVKELKENQFNGSGSQDPWEHLSHFQESCEIREIPQDVTEDQKKLCLSTYSLTRDTKDRLHLLPSGTIQTWKEL